MMTYTQGRNKMPDLNDQKKSVVHLKTSTYMCVSAMGMFHIKKNAYNSRTKLLLGALKCGYISSF
jgi:hypothetical protein